MFTDGLTDRTFGSSELNRMYRDVLYLLYLDNIH